MARGTRPDRDLALSRGSYHGGTSRAVSPLRARCGSHLEILERDAGYKGFNQAGINEIIRETDPPKQAGTPRPTIDLTGSSGFRCKTSQSGHPVNLSF